MDATYQCIEPIPDRVNINLSNYWVISIVFIEVLSFSQQKTEVKLVYSTVKEELNSSLASVNLVPCSSFPSSSYSEKMRWERGCRISSYYHLLNSLTFNFPITIKSRQMICFVIQLTGSYMVGAMNVNSYVTIRASDIF